MIQMREKKWHSLSYTFKYLQAFVLKMKDLESNLVAYKNILGQTDSFVYFRFVRNGPNATLQVDNNEIINKNPDGNYFLFIQSID